MASGKVRGALPQQGSKVPDMPNRNAQRQTIPDEAEDELPPAYEEDSQRNIGPSPAARTSGSTNSGGAQASAPTLRLVATGTTPSNDPEGYLITDPMHWELKEQRGDWDKYDNEPGCLCSSQGGVLCSSRGGVMCSDREGFFCSDRNGRFFSDRGGLWCSDLGGFLCSSGGNEAARKRQKNNKKETRGSCNRS